MKSWKIGNEIEENEIISWEIEYPRRSRKTEQRKKCGGNDQRNNAETFPDWTDM